MRSSIFSSSFAPLIKGVGAALATIFLAWALVPSHLPFDEYPAPGPQALNELVLEKYLADYARKPVVLLGSSIQFQIPPAACRPQTVASIHLSGRGAMSGLEALRRTGAHPETVFIEITTLLIGVDETLLDSVFAPLYWRIRSLVPPLRHDRNWFVLWYRSKIHDRRPVSLTQTEPDETLDEWLASHKRKYQSKRADSAIERGIPEIVARVQALQAKGTRVLLQDPADPRLRAMSPLKDLRAALKAALPDVEWVDAPDDLFPIYRFDGLHFHNASGLRYFQYLMGRAGLAVETPCKLIVNQSEVQARASQRGTTLGAAGQADFDK